MHPLRPYQSRRDFLRTALGSTVAVAALGAAATPAMAGPGAGTGTVPTASGGGLPDEALRAGLRAVTDAGMPGVFAEVRDGHATWRGASGVADLETGRPIRPDFQHRVGSINKTFVATALLQLVAERRLSLDAPVRRYLPQLVPAGVTVRMLLNQTGGLNDYDHVLFATPEDIEKYQHTTIKPMELARIGLAEPPVGAPGERHYYANTNYILAGLLLERITGRPAAVELTRRILRPLGLHRSYFPGTATRIEGPHSAGYLPWIDATLRDFSVYNMSWSWMAGELVSTTADLNRFFRALLGGRLLRPAELAEMRRTVPGDPDNPDGGRYGLGLISAPLPGVPAWGHDGVVFGSETMSLHSADGRRQVTVALNASHYSAPGYPNPIGAALFDFLITALGGTAPAPTAADRALGSRAGHERFTPAPGAAALASSGHRLVP
ncbi:beta-lactamase family protein [Plantactinospora sp. S1510]|uniref:Beta-lactamase family protein n=1 Tax=Plantactinospora alkalitolerans TaxID=2789879 RepID=A0ABS0GQZ8_9ACTN|nr:serine hydrolase domain-containing protein [Plantactinospora alkalitolerans]MBF9128595.1 beta-lactamase family protein [Plantactinospora alkalitolerans]